MPVRPNTAVVALLASVFAIAAPAAVATASPLELYSFGGRSSGLAGAGVAVADNYDAVYLNPAGLTQATGRRLTLGGSVGSLQLQIDGDVIDGDDPLATSFGAVIPMPFIGALEDKVTLGLGFQIPQNALVRVEVPAPGDPYFALLGTRSDAIGIQVAVGYRISDRWQVGVGVLTLAALRGTILVTADAAGGLSTQSEQRLTSHFAPIVGGRFVASDRLVIGAVFRGVSRSDYNIVVDPELGDALPLGLPDLNIAGTAQYDPLAVAASAAYQLSPALTLIGQLDYQRWSAYPLPTKNPVQMQDPLEPAGFRDSVTPRIAAEGRRLVGGLELTGRAGYAFALSPAPEMTGRQTLLDNHRHIAALGFGLATVKSSVPLFVDVWAQAHLLMSRTHDKDPAKFPDGDVPFASVRASGRIFIGGITVGVQL